MMEISKVFEQKTDFKPIRHLREPLTIVQWFSVTEQIIFEA